MVASALRRADRPAAALDVPLLLLALPALPLVRVLPAEGVGLYLRLAVATAVVLLPGFLVARAFGLRSTSAGLVLALALLFGSLALTFAFSAALVVAGITLVVAGGFALPFALRRTPEALDRASGAVFAVGVLFGAALWLVSRAPTGDALFHLGRVQKLVAFDELSLAAVGEFADGGLHPGYAVPLWHGFLALVAEVAAVDPPAVLEHEASVLAPLAFVVAFEAGAAVFASRPLGGAVLAAHVALAGLAPPHGGLFASLAQPGTAGRLLLVPATIALVLAWARAPALVLLLPIAAAGLALAVVHPTYALFLALVLGGFAAARALLAPADAPRLAAALAAFLAPAGAFVLWLLPVVRDTVSYRPGAAELRRALRRYEAEVDVVSDSLYRLAPEVLARRGSVAVAALALVPLAALAPRRRFAAFVLGGTVAVLAVLLVPELFTRFSDAVSLSQARRAAAFVPLPFAFAAGAAVLAAALRLAVLPVALVAGIALQLAFPGDFTTLLVEGGGPAAVVWFALAAGVLALVAAAVAVRRGWALDVRDGPLPLAAALLFVAPVGVQAVGDWSAEESRARSLTPGLVEALRARVPERAVVFSDPDTSYRVAAYAPVYVASATPAHVADTVDNRPRERRRDALRFVRNGDLAIPRRYGAGWIVIARERWRTRVPLPVVYADARYALYRLRS